MADDGIFATNAEVLRKAGANASSTSSAVAYTDDFLTQIESFINSFCRFNFSDAYTGLDVDVKGLLKEVATNLGAIYVISYDEDVIGRSTAESRIVILRDAALRGLSILKDKKTQDFINGA